jgi:hypothetical protein
MMLIKTRSADQIETGIAGQVDIATLRPFDFKGLEISATARALYLDVAKKTNPNVSALISDRWDTSLGEVGALVNVSYSRTKYSDQAVTAGALVPFATADNPPPGYTPLQRIFNPTPNPLQPGVIPDLLWQAFLCPALQIRRPQRGPCFRQPDPGMEPASQGSGHAADLQRHAETGGQL